MASGDGLICRIRPRHGRFTGRQIAALCDLAERFGNGILEVTRRANLQIRGLDMAGHAAALEALAQQGLLDPDAETERRRNLVIEPFWQAGDLSLQLAEALLPALQNFPALPAKAGFAIDCGARALLGDTSADLRFELSDTDGLILRADGAPAGRAVAPEHAIDAAREMACWYADHLNGPRGRMRDVIARHALPEEWQSAPPRAPQQRPGPGPTPLGALAALPFGQITASALRAVTAGAPIRLTPWRIILVEGREMPLHPEIITDPTDPLLRVDACPGAPRCASAFTETHGLARTLASRTGGSLHVSGCAKGCARSAPADLTIVGTAEGFDIIEKGTAQAVPTRGAVARGALLADIDQRHAP
jgi:precorrin-3B synthase